MSAELRPLAADDLDAAFRLSRLAFGAPASERRRWGERVAQTAAYGMYQDDSLLAVTRVCDFGQYFGGRVVPMGGLAGVAVAPEQRRRGLSARLLGGLLPILRNAGQVISALYPTVPEVYRRQGWEVAGTLERVFLDTAQLAVVVADPAVRTRQIGAADLATVHDLYTAFATEGTGLLTRTGPRFPARRLLELDSVVLAERAGRATGYLALDRGEGCGPDHALTGHDLVAADPGTLRTLLRGIGAYAPLVPRIELATAPHDGLALVCPAALDTPGPANPWMLRVVDAPAAVAARGWPPGAAANVDLSIADQEAPWNDGSWRLAVADGRGSLERAGAGSVRLDIRGLSSLYTGYAQCALLRRTGLLTGPTEHDSALDAAFAGPRPAMLDYF